MKIDEHKDAVPETVPGQDQQNRREFFNGLGRWSMIVVAAVSFLGGAQETQAKKPKPHHKHENETFWVNSPHTKYPKYTKDPGPGRIQ